MFIVTSETTLFFETKDCITIHYFFILNIHRFTIKVRFFLSRYFRAIGYNAYNSLKNENLLIRVWIRTKLLRVNEYKFHTCTICPHNMSDKPFVSRYVKSVNIGRSPG